jgi:hypothetical protein|tara:strand:+ start:236 stop:511 length:276 start_codon:yes stop_codon:yes gene_type:complete
MNRKERRALKSAAKKSGADASSLEKSLGMFDLLPDECNACSRAFDKKSRDMAFTWHVVVRKEPDTVRLFCPECIDQAKDVVDKKVGGKDVG